MDDEYDPDPPTPEEVEEAYRFKYGVGADADQGCAPEARRGSAPYLRAA